MDKLSWLVVAAMAVGLGGCSSAPLRDTQFASCEAARSAVTRAEKTGVQFGHERVYSDPMCFFAGLNYTQFPAVREVGGQVCELGYICIEMGSEPGE